MQRYKKAGVVGVYERKGMESSKNVCPRSPKRLETTTGATSISCVCSSSTFLIFPRRCPARSGLVAKACTVRFPIAIAIHNIGNLLGGRRARSIVCIQRRRQGPGARGREGEILSSDRPKSKGERTYQRSLICESVRSIETLVSGGLVRRYITAFNARDGRRSLLDILRTRTRPAFMFF